MNCAVDEDRNGGVSALVDEIEERERRDENRDEGKVGVILGFRVFGVSKLGFLQAEYEIEQREK